jgi:hypothetical protein
VEGLCVLRRRFVVLWVHWVVVVVIGGWVFIEHVGQSFLGKPFLQYCAEVKVHRWGNDTRKGEIKHGKLLARAKRPAGKVCVVVARQWSTRKKREKKEERGPFRFQGRISAGMEWCGRKMVLLNMGSGDARGEWRGEDAC